MMEFNEFVSLRDKKDYADVCKDAAKASFKDRMYAEMSKRKKKGSQANIAPKDKSPFGTIKIQLGPAAIGHQGHISGTGVHDNRPKRQRTRGAAKSAAVKEYD